MEEAIHYPRPTYDRCNAGHVLVEVYNEKQNAFIWDCPICIRKMKDVKRNVDITFCEECGIGYPDDRDSCPNCGTWKED